MNDLVQERQLADNGVKYVSEILKKGGPLASSLDISADGEVWTYVPEKLMAEPLDYSEGGILSPEEAFEAEQKVSGLLVKFVHLSSSNVILFEDQSFKIGDPAIADDEYIFECEGVLYHYRTQSAGGGTADELQEAMGIASQYPTIILLASAQRELPRNVSIPYTRTQELIQAVRHVIVGSYDEEGFVIWSLNKSELT